MNYLHIYIDVHLYTYEIYIWCHLSNNSLILIIRWQEHNSYFANDIKEFIAYIGEARLTTPTHECLFNLFLICFSQTGNVDLSSFTLHWTYLALCSQMLIFLWLREPGSCSFCSGRHSFQLLITEKPLTSYLGLPIQLGLVKGQLISRRLCACCASKSPIILIVSISISEWKYIDKVPSFCSFFSSYQR